MTAIENILTKRRFVGLIHRGECRSEGVSSRLQVWYFSLVQDMLLYRRGRPPASELLWLGLFLCQSLSAAVTFTNTPSAVSNQYTGTISLQITRLTNGETVLVQTFLD